MADVNLASLNFSVDIPNADEFTKKITEMRDAAKALNTSMSELLTFKGNLTPYDDAYVQNVKNVAKAYTEIAKAEEKVARESSKTASRKKVDDAKAEAAALKEAAKARGTEARETLKTEIAQERLNRLQKEGNSLLGQSSRLWREMGTMVAAYFSVHGAVNLVKTLTRVTAEFELQKVTLGAILQDTETANKLFEQLKVLAVKSPFQFKELATYAKQLSAFSIPAKELYDTTKMLADVSAGLGVGMDRLVLAYGQIRSASFLRGQEVRQLTEAGIPILEELRKQFVALGEEGITVGDVFDKISKRMVPFEMVEKVFKGMTEEGGKFYQMQEVQAETLKGKISNLTDAYQIMFAEIGDKKSGMLKGAVDLARSLAENYERVGKTLVVLIATYGGYRALLSAINAIDRARLISEGANLKMVKALRLEIAALTKETAAYKAITTTLKNLNPWAVLGAALVAYTTYMVATNVQAERFRRELNKIAQSHGDTFHKQEQHLHDLVAQLKNAEQGSANYRDAIMKLNSQYGEYLPNLLTEKSTLYDIAEAERQVTNALRERMRAQAEAEGLQKIESKEGDRMSKVALNLVSALQGKGVAEQTAQGFVQKFREALEQGSGSIESVFHAALSDWLQGDYNKWGDESVRYWNEILPQAQKYGEEMRKVVGMQEDLNTALESNFGKSVFATAEEQERIGAIEEKYRQKELEYRKQVMTDEQLAAKLKEDNLAKLKETAQAYEEMAKQAEQRGKGGMFNTQINQIKQQIDALEGAEESWLQKVINPIAQGAGLEGLIVQAGDSLGEVADKARKEYKSLTDQLDDAKDAYSHFIDEQNRGNAVDAKALKESEDLVKSLEKRKKGVEDIGKAIGISVNDKVKTPRSSASSGKSQEQEDLEMRRDTLKDIYRWYQKLTEAGMDGQSIKELLTNYFPDEQEVIEGRNYEKVLLEIADALEQYDRKMAKALRDDVSGRGLDADFEKWQKAKKAADDYANFMEDWLDSSELFGEGSEFNISGVINKYKKKLQEFDNKRTEAIEKLYAKANAEGIFGLGYLEEGRKIDEKYLNDTSNALKEANESVRKEAEKWVKNWEGFGDIDLSHMADLTARELTKLQDKLAELAQNPEAYFGDMAEELAEAGLDIETFKEAVLKAIDDINGQAQEKKWMEIVRQVKRYKQALDVSIDSINKLADATRDPALKGFADDLDKAADAAVKMVEALANGDTFGAIMAIVTHVADVWMDAISASIEFKHAVDDLTLSFQEMRYAADLATGVESIFGHNTFRAIQNAYNLITSLSSTMRGLEGTLTSITVSTQKSKWWEFLLAPTAPAAWAKLFTSKNTTIMELLAETGAELYDEMGRVNVEALQKISDTYDNFSDKERKALEQAIVDAKAYNDALDQLDDAMGSLVGGIADDFASKIVEQWKAAGNAAADYGDILDDIATQYAEMFVKNAIMDNIFNGEFQDMLTSLTLSRDSSGVMDLFAKKVKELEEYYPFFEDVLNSLSGYFTEESASKSNTLGGGIKSITEDTANLLASYINAIRADVAAIRQSVAAEGAMNLPTPTLAEYLTQIQANTYNNAVAAQAILENLQSMMTTSDGPALRVFM